MPWCVAYGAFRIALLIVQRILLRGGQRHAVDQAQNILFLAAAVGLAVPVQILAGYPACLLAEGHKVVAVNAVGLAILLIRIYDIRLVGLDVHARVLPFIDGYDALRLLAGIPADFDNLVNQLLTGNRTFGKRLPFIGVVVAVLFFEGPLVHAQIPFQYSLHYIEQEGGVLKHKEFLARSGTDPRRALAEQLCEDIPMNVCTTAYNKAFECTRLAELAEQFPDLAEHLLNIRDNIVDLLVPFQSGYYYNRAMGGSFSIKSVLPAIFPDDPSLDYHNLEGVHNGSEAMSIFPKIKDMPPEEQEKARHNLLKYCELDTYAMVKVWQALCHAAE